ncbi:molybdopterin-dependent oxidoreductase [Azoarcus indigens]|uniref:CO/xanthine dehydrogenase Mo-binding subunit n=1 Tax=Azoarcus indigens TaxID=29545 RepID=A0A4R6DXK3_9RHOO|nr:molybdopterin cofactor-binding domain-containing protein [Azoarcus indigens]NMG65710.1 molybdopterin-dependent oxidoreductase [Azoarcus indigens]TDN50027.1 CO/xanthine dehydrogenase Mo-binding subunit [Azoarcus indigens]
MIEHGPTPKDFRQALLDSDDSLLVLRPPQAAARPAPGQPGVVSDYVPALPDIFIAVRGDGSVLAFNGHVDLGTGIRTALGQLVAEELDAELGRVSVMLGHTEAAPNQGPTIASSTIQISAMPLRRAAAQARAWLLARAAQRLGVAEEAVAVADGAFFCPAEPGRRLGYAELLAGERVRLEVAAEFPLKPASAHKLVGRSTPRVDIPAKATGALTFVHDMRLPGMLHGRVVRPPYAGIDCGDFVGRSLVKVDRDSVRGLPGLVDVVVIGDFVGVVAEREEQAIAAMKALKVEWRLPALPALDDVEAAIRAIPAVRRPLREEGDTDAALAAAPAVLARSYVWPYQMHGSIGPSCALADYREGGLTVWSGTQNPHMLRVDLARLLQVDEGGIEVVRMEAAGCYGRNCADDVGADAALLSRAVGRPVRVQLSREQEHAWEPKGAGQLMDVKGAVDAAGNLAAYDFVARYPSNDAPLLALLLTGALDPAPRMLEMGDRTAVPPYAYPNMRIACDDVPAIVRAGWLRGVSALPNSFAHDSFIDELAVAAGADRVEFRLRHLPDSRAADLLRAVAEQAGWQPGCRGSRGTPDADGLLRGRGASYARYVHSKFPGFGAAWSAWIIDLAVDPASGAVTVERLVVGQDTGMMVNPDGVRHQIHGNVLQTLSRMFKEEVRFADGRVAALEWGAYPILGFAEVPPVEVLLMPRQDEPPLGAGESASVPGAAAVANALFDATGLRFRRPPFTRARIGEALAGVCDVVG